MLEERSHVVGESVRYLILEEVDVIIDMLTRVLTDNSRTFLH